MGWLLQSKQLHTYVYIGKDGLATSVRKSARRWETREEALIFAINRLHQSHRWRTVYDLNKRKRKADDK
jgi:hypothetical protein